MANEGIAFKSTPVGKASKISLQLRRDAREGFVAELTRFSEGRGYRVQVLRTPKPVDRVFLTMENNQTRIFCSDVSNEGAADISYGLYFSGRDATSDPNAILQHELESFANALDAMDGISMVRVQPQ
jgi:hypothetical protein